MISRERLKELEEKYDRVYCDHNDENKRDFEIPWIHKLFSKMIRQYSFECVYWIMNINKYAIIKEYYPFEMYRLEWELFKLPVKFCDTPNIYIINEVQLVYGEITDLYE